MTGLPQAGPVDALGGLSQAGSRPGYQAVWTFDFGGRPQAGLTELIATASFPGGVFIPLHLPLDRELSHIEDIH